MKNIYSLLILVFLVMPSVTATTEIILLKESNEEILIGNFAELAQVRGNNLLVEYDLELDITNISSINKDIKLIFSFTKGEDRFFTPTVREVFVCQPIEEEGVQWGHNYDHINLIGCNITLKHSFNKEEDIWRYKLIIPKENITPNKLGYTPVYIRLIFEYPNFIITRPDLKILWLDLSVQPTPRYLERYLKTEDDAVIDSLLNYKIIRYDLDKDQFILKASELGDAQFFYKNAQEESNKRFIRDMIIIIISFGLSLVFGFLFSEEKLSKKTKDLLIICGASIFFMGDILLMEPNNVLFTFILLILFILLVIGSLLAVISLKKDNLNSTRKKEL